jgi:hypothetical protein
VADWAGSVAGRFPSLPAILVTHEFIDMKSALAASDGLPRRTTRHSPGSGPAYRLGGTGDALCGADLWERLVGPHAGFEFVFSGHYFHRERDASGRSLVTAEIAHAFRSDVRPEGCCAGNGMPNQRTRGGKQNGPAGPSGGLCAACRPSPMGRTVHQMLFNPQWLPGGGQGWLRLLRFSADRSHVRVETFSPWLEREVGPEAAFRTNAAHRFIIPRGGAPP